MKIILLVTLFLSSLYAEFDFHKIYKLNDFNNFKIYIPNDDYFKNNLQLKKGVITKKDIKKLNKLFTQEKMVRDLLLMLSKQYEYDFMPYIAMLTHKQLLIIEAFYKKYNLNTPEELNYVGKFKKQTIQIQYKQLLKDSLNSKELAAKLSVKFIKKLINEYNITLKNLPKGFKKQLLKSNAFNKKVLRMFKKGLRNIEMGLPIE